MHFSKEITCFQNGEKKKKKKDSRFSRPVNINPNLFEVGKETHDDVGENENHKGYLYKLCYIVNKSRFFFFFCHHLSHQSISP